MLNNETEVPMKKGYPKSLVENQRIDLGYLFI